MNKTAPDKTSATPANRPGPGSDLAFAQQVLTAEAQAVARICLDDNYQKAVDLVVANTGGSAAGSVVVSGLGKSNFVGQKISATFASTGTPSHFLHPAEAMHGDLGRIRRGDVVILLSFSGNTQEIVTLATTLRQDRVPIIAITGTPHCDLGRLANVVLCIGDVTEACPLNLAPTASTTAMLALGDALALTVMRRRNFGVSDFRKYHPGGSLGRQLMPVVQAMRFRPDENLPLFPQDMLVQQALSVDWPGDRRAGAMLVVDQTGRLAGIFTDGDLRRLVRSGAEVLTKPIGQVMTRNPRHLTHDALVRDAVQMVREYRIDEVPIVDAAGCPIGLIDVQDLVALKVIDG